MTKKSEFVIPASWSSRPSPNFSTRKGKIDCIVLHADAASRIDSSLDWVRRKESKVSYHIMIGRTGNVFSIVHPDNRAWHAGVSSFEGRSNVNDFSIGVCLSNKNDGTEAYPASQIQSAAKVCRLLVAHYDIPIARITTHAAISPGRKTDPLGFDLEAFKTLVESGA